MNRWEGLDEFVAVAECGQFSAAAERLGFQYEGTFRQALIYKGRNRDTAWFSIIDKEWPLVKAAFQQWLAPENFDERAHQIKRLQLIRSHLASLHAGDT